MLRPFYEKELHKENHKEFRDEKVIKRMTINYMVNGNDTTFFLITG